MSKVKQLKQTKKAKQIEESDGNYFLKIVLYIVLGSLWVKFIKPIPVGDMIITGLPVGLLLGLVFASRDHFQVDRKIEYVLLIIIGIMTLFLPIGIFI